MKLLVKWFSEERIKEDNMYLLKTKLLIYVLKFFMFFIFAGYIIRVATHTDVIRASVLAILALVLIMWLGVYIEQDKENLKI